MLITPPSTSDTTVSAIQAEYSKLLINYPLESPLDIPVGVYVTEQLFSFWDDISPYLPHGSKLSKAYVRPEDHATNGLNKLKELNPLFDFGSVAVARSASPVAKADSSAGAGFFNGPTITQSTADSSTVLKKTHPSLNGKFGDYYLFQFDYENIKTALALVGYVWELPLADNYQKGLSLDIDLTETTISVDLTLALIASMLTTNQYLNAELATLSGKVITIKFKSAAVPSFPFDYGILNVGPDSNVSDCFSQTVVERIYKNLKANGHGDIADTVPASALRGVPFAARRKGTALAVAIRDSLIDVLGGSEGLFSVMQASTNEYLMGIINGLLASNKVIYDELDRIGGGAVKQKALEAFESGMNRAVVSKGVQSLLNSGTEINNSTGRSILAKEPTNVVQSNIADIKATLGTARTQES